MQEASERKDNLTRPPCMEDDGFVSAAVQCPPKKRGRKKKQAANAPEPVEPEPSTSEMKTSLAALGIDTRGMSFLELAALRELTEHEQSTAKGRPSAAALGYDTVGLTDAQVAAGKGSKTKNGPKKNNRKVEDNDAPGGKDTDRKTSKKVEPEEPTTLGHDSRSAAEPAPAPKRKSKKTAAAEEAECLDEAEPAPAPKRKSKRLQQQRKQNALMKQNLPQPPSASPKDCSSRGSRMP